MSSMFLKPQRERKDELQSKNCRRAVLKSIYH